jgi:hypothetical protein
MFEAQGHSFILQAVALARSGHVPVRIYHHHGPRYLLCLPGHKAPPGCLLVATVGADGEVTS